MSGRAIRLAAFAALVASAPPLASAFAHVEVGQRFDAPILATVDGGKAPVVARDARANVFVFVRPNHDHSAEALRMVAQCQRELAGKPVRWVAIVSSVYPRDEARELVRASGAQLPVLVDENDGFYGALGVKLHPTIGIADADSKLLAYEPFRKVQYCDIVRARVRHALGEIDAAEVERSVHPDKAVMPNDVKGAAAHRHVKLGDAFAKKGNCAAAVKAYDEALQLDPQAPGAAEGKQHCAGSTSEPGR